MSRARHRAKGGKVVAYAGGDSNVMKEARERKRGGAVPSGEGDEAKERHDRVPRRAAGGAVSRLRRGGRATGGKIGADKAPLSSAARVKHLPGEIS